MDLERIILDQYISSFFIVKSKPDLYSAVYHTALLRFCKRLLVDNYKYDLKVLREFERI